MKAKPIIIAGFILFLLFNLSAESPSFIEVTGKGLATVSSDYILISFEIVTKNPSYEQTQKLNDQIAEKVFRLLRTDYRIQKESVTTTSYSLQKVYKYEQNRGQVEDGYQARNHLQVKLYDFDKYKTLLTDLLDAGVDQINSISFGVEDLETPKLTALKVALENARKKAQVLAEATGVRLGQPLVITETTAVSAPRPIAVQNAFQTRESLGGATGDNQTISDGTRVIEANVLVRFEIE